VAITQGLARTTVIHANVLNASQVAMAALAGIFLFAEPLTPWLTLGVVLTICGIILVKPASKSGAETVPAGI
jgi:drug/metabolite transporter (DMT)-like permease